LPTSRAAQDADDGATRQQVKRQPDELSEQGLAGDAGTVHLRILVCQKVYVKSEKKSWTCRAQSKCYARAGMKLLIYSHFFAPSIGGVETVVQLLASGLAELRTSTGVRNFEVTLVTQTEARNCDDRELSFGVIRHPSFLELWRLIGETDRVLLAGPAILPLLFSLLRGKTAVVTHHGYQVVCPNGMLFQFAPRTICPGHFAAKRYGECLRCNAPQEGWLGSFRLLLLTFVRRGLARRASINVGVSENVARKVALPDLRIIRNAVPDFEGSANGMQLQVDARGTPSFAYIGRLVTEKGVRVLLEAAGLLAQEGLKPPISIIGDGPERQALEQQKVSLKLGENVAFLGFQHRPALEEHMMRVDVLVMPSLCEEVAPLSVLEMMMQGRLIIGSKIGGLAEQLAETGLTFAPGDASALASCMQEVIKKPDLVTRLGVQARARALQFYSLGRMTSDYRNLIDTTPKA